jgi:hypothetical protein
MKRLLLACALGATALSAGCASMITGGPLVRPNTATGYINIQNNTRLVQNVVLISACSASTYGLNRLPSGMGIRPGGSYRFQVSAGCWDVGVGETMMGNEGYRRISVPANTVYTLNVG